ncbi:MAG TPA: type II toxin-antitoxin system RelE/ParE family toxin [Candidatus Saccharimonadales bacterium]|jgi:mRNA interferase RelE/StbE|nr:type II toxin-antitoxin system RelE/ParE family toxin [Candidatus Saccharimonadales bacterium]
MSAYKLLYKKPAVKAIQKLPPQIQKRLKTKLEWFVTQANSIDFAEPLTKPADAQYRFRVGVYRVLFDIEAKNIVVLYVQHRRDVYRK